MNLSEFNALIGQDSYVRCLGKKRIDNNIVSEQAADAHLFNGGQIGWWVRSGYIIIDIDEGKQEALEIVKKMKVKTLMAQTPKGLHLFFKSDKDFPQRVGMVLPCGLKCDFRCANKGYVILPFGEEGRKFNNKKEVADLPFEFTPLVNRRDSLYELKEGDGRNSTLFSHLMAYKNRGATDKQIESMAGVINKITFKDPMDDKELETIVGNTKKYEAAEELENPYVIYTEKGKPSQINARAVADYFVNRGDIYVIGSDCFQYINGVYIEASSFVRNMIKDMVVYDNLITYSKLLDCYKLIVDDTRLQRSATELNANKNLVNFKNGVWDINSKTMLPHDSKYLQTIQIPHEVHKSNTKLKNTQLMDFFNKCALPKEDIDMVLRFMCYCLTTDFGLKTFLILVGQSNTGKSVLIRFIESMVGRYNTAALSMHELNQRFYPAQLYGKLVNSCADNKTLPLSSIENLKKITGGDQIMHEKKGKEPFFFVPFSKLVFSFNQLPLQLEEKSNAFYKRMRVLYMNKELFLNNEYVDNLCSDDSIEEVLPHLLNLLPLDSMPSTVKSNELVEALRSDSDSIHAFMTSLCITEERKYTPKEKLYQAYAEFCITTGREAHKKHGFNRSIRSMGFREGRRHKTREYCWKGIGLKKRTD